MVESLSRRRFLGTTVAAAAAALAARSPASASYKVGLETYTFHDLNLAGTLSRTRELGVRYLELHDGHLPREASGAELAAAKNALADAGIRATGVYIHDAFTDSEAVARPIFDYAKTMGFTYINGGPQREALPLLDRLVPEYGIRIALHNHGPKARYETLADVTSMLEKYPNISACIDIGHFARSKVDPVEATRVLGKRAVAIHVKDVTAVGENAVLGEGTIDLPGVFRSLRESRFAGLVVLEYEGDFDDMQQRLAGMRKSLVVLEQLISAIA
jgi:sugar phosphate isomerase/epimerase